MLEPPVTDRPAPPTRRPGLVACACVAAGVLTADALPLLPAAAWLATACLSLVAAALLRRRAGVMLALSALLIGAGLMSARVLTTPADRLALPASEVLAVRGVMRTPATHLPAGDEWARPLHWRGPPTRFDLALGSMQIGGTWQPASGLLTVYGPTTGVPIQPAARVELIGAYRPVSAPANPGQLDQRRWAAQEGRVGSLRIESSDALTVLEPDTSTLSRGAATLRSLHATIRGAARNALDIALGGPAETDGPARALLRAMLLGDESPALRPVSESTARLGIIHIISISGFHLALVAWVVLLLTRLTGDRGTWEYPVSAAAIALYLLVVPAEAPVLRSGIMVLALLLSESTGRRYDRLNTLGWTACALLLWRPLDLYTPGFQLSLGVTAVLIWRASDWRNGLLDSGYFGTPGVKGRYRRIPTTWMDVVKRWTADLLVATALAWIVSAPVVAGHVGMVSLLGVAAGLILTPLSMVALGAGFIGLLLALAWPAAGAAVGSLAVITSHLIVQGADLAAGLPGAAMTLPALPVGWVIAATLTALCAVAPSGWRRVTVKAAALLSVGWLVVILLTAVHPVEPPQLHRFALARSSASLLRSADQALLIDPGSASTRSGPQALRRAVAACGAWRVRTVLITGPQVERFNHLPDLVQSLGITDAIIPPTLAELARGRQENDAARLVKRLITRGVRIHTLEPGESLSLGPLTVTPLAAGQVRIDSPGRPAMALHLTPLEQATTQPLSPSP